MASSITPTTAVVAVALGGAIAAGAIRSVWRSIRARRWPRVDGIVEFYTVTWRDVDDHPYEVRVSYVYTVDGRHYGGERIRFGPPPRFGTAAAAEAWAAARYPARGAVRVHVDPADPWRAVLDVEESAATLLACVAGLAAVVLGIGALLAGV